MVKHIVLYTLKEGVNKKEAVELIRSVLEPRLIGKHLGLDPLVTLMALYAGFKLFGLPGMLLSPMLAVAVTQLIEFKPEG